MKKITNDDFIKRAKEIHEDKYDYSKVNYVNTKTKVCIVCPEHGEFWQTPSDHLQKKGCPKCANNYKYTTKEFIDKSIYIHGNKYDYSKVNYVNRNTKVCIICPEHGEFWQTPSDHLQNKGCPKCCYDNLQNYNNSSLLLAKNSFITKSMQIHGNKYDYSKVNYVNSKDKVCIICPEHGEFWQKPNIHLNGHGCSKCAYKKYVNELRLKNYLEVNFNNVIYQKKFEWLSPFMSIDFFLPDYNIAIEYQGRQHFKPISCFGGEIEYKKTCERDKIKYHKCLEHNIKLIYFTYDKRNIPEKYFSRIFLNENKLLEFIVK